jgi:hypothetical protein
VFFGKDFLSRRTMERELLQQQWIGKDSEFEKQWREASSSYHKFGKGFELKKQWSDVSKTFLSIGKDLAQRSRRILEQISVTEIMILKKFCNNEETYLAAAGWLADYGERD